MSFRGMSVRIAAENLASAEFTKVTSDAARMASEVAAHPISIEFEPIEAPPIPPIEAPSIPPIDVSPIQEAGVAFREAGLEAAEMGTEVEASAGGFSTLQSQAEATTVSLSSVAMAFSSVVSVGSAVISLAGDLGIVDKETAKWARTILTVITLTSAYIRMKAYLTTVTTGHTAAVALNTTMQSANASTSIASAAAHHIHAAACWVATAAQNALNISYATFLALTGVGIAVIITAAAAMWYFANSMNAATESVKGYNEAAAETPTYTRSITRAGEEELRRRGIE